MLATGVESITFEVTDPAVARRFVVGREFDIFGSPSGQPTVILGDCNLDGMVNFGDVPLFVSAQ